MVEDQDLRNVAQRASTMPPQNAIPLSSLDACAEQKHVVVPPVRRILPTSDIGRIAGDIPNMIKWRIGIG